MESANFVTPKMNLGDILVTQLIEHRWLSLTNAIETEIQTKKKRYYEHNSILANFGFVSLFVLSFRE